jgi:hypothetical protein
LRAIARLYPDQSQPPPYGAGSGWNAVTVEGTAQDPVVKIALSEPAQTLSGATDQWLELIVPDYDLNDDGLVNFADLGLLKISFSTDPEYDFNRDGFVDDADLEMIQQVFFTATVCGGQECQIGECPDYPSR